MKIKDIIKIIKGTSVRNITNVREIGFKELNKAIENNLDMVIVDIRSPQEYAEKKIKNAINIPLYDLKKEKTLQLLPDKNQLIILYCACGVRSKKAYKNLEEMGYTNLYSLKGGLDNI